MFGGIFGGKAKREEVQPVSDAEAAENFLAQLKGKLEKRAGAPVYSARADIEAGDEIASVLEASGIDRHELGNELTRIKEEHPDVYDKYFEDVEPKSLGKFASGKVVKANEHKEVRTHEAAELVNDLAHSTLESEEAEAIIASFAERNGLTSAAVKDAIANPESSVFSGGPLINYGVNLTDLQNATNYVNWMENNEGQGQSIASRGFSMIVPPGMEGGFQVAEACPVENKVPNSAQNIDAQQEQLCVRG